MQVVETSSEGLKREFTVTIPADEIEKRVDEKLAEISQKVTLKGFRPGKVPASLLKKMYGKSVLGEVLEEAVNESSRKALEDNEIRPAMQPRIEVTKFDDGSELEYKLAVETMPEFEMVDFSKIEIEKPVAEATEEEIDKALANIASQQKTFAKVKRNRKSRKGDAVLIDFVGKVDGVPFEGGAAEDYELELGSGTFIPGFEDQIIGAKGGESVEVKVTFPENYGNAELAGKDAVFEVTVKEVREPVEVEINDEFAQKLGLENLEALKNAVKEQIENQFSQASRMRMKRDLLDKLAEMVDFPVPEGMVQGEYEQICRQLNPQAADDHDHDHAEGEEHEHKPVDDGLDDEQKAEFRAIAERRVRLGLLLSEVGAQNNITVPVDEVNRAIMEQARQYPGQERQVIEFYQNNPEAMNQVRAPLFEDKVIDFIAELAKVTEKKVSAEELMKDPDEEEGSEEG